MSEGGFSAVWPAQSQHESAEAPKSLHAGTRGETRTCWEKQARGGIARTYPTRWTLRSNSSWGQDYVLQTHRASSKSFIAPGDEHVRMSLNLRINIRSCGRTSAMTSVEDWIRCTVNPVKRHRIWGRAISNSGMLLMGKRTRAHPSPSWARQNCPTSHSSNPAWSRLDCCKRGQHKFARGTTEEGWSSVRRCWSAIPVATSSVVIVDANTWIPPACSTLNAGITYLTVAVFVRVFIGTSLTTRRWPGKAVGKSSSASRCTMIVCVDVFLQSDE